METDIKLDEQPEEDCMYDNDVVDVVRALVESYNAIDEIDKALLSKEKQKQMKSWQNKIWNSIEYYVNRLTCQDDSE